MPAALECRLLGPFELVIEGRTIALGSARQRALLVILALNATEVVSRDRLIDELWGEMPPPTAAKALQVHVSQLRKLLPGDVLVTRAPGYALRIDPEAIDVRRFARLAAEGREALARGAAMDASQRLGEGLALWRGPPLGEFAFEPFADAEIGRLEDLRITALEDRIDADLALGRTDLADELEGLVAQHPLRERLRGQLMLALYRAGRQAEALEAYRDTRRALVEDLGIEPGPELQRLEQAILRQDPSLAPHGPRAAMAAARTAHDDFVGREGELALLEQRLEEAMGGGGSLVLVAGEAGIGKSRLIEELAHRARHRGARVLAGRCWEAGGAPAYWPWVQVLRSYLREAGPGTVRSEVAGLGTDLVGILPELREIVPAVEEPPDRDPDEARFRLFDAATSFLRRAAGSQPLVLVLDDLHAADAPTLLLLRFLAGEVAGTRLLVIGAYREDELVADHPLAAALAELARAAATQRVSLAGLDRPDVRRFVAIAAGREPSDALGTAIYEETEGNPLFLGEIVRLLAAERRLDDAGGDDGSWKLTVPQGVREVIGRRLRHLSRECRGLLVQASVLGREFDLEAVARLAGDERQTLLGRLDEAAAARVVSEVAGMPGRLRFAHALVRDTLYEELTPARRAHAHRRTGEVLEELYSADPEPQLAELAHHFFAAAQDGDATKAIDYGRRAGDRAASQLAYEEAARLYGLAYHALSREAPSDHEAQCRLLLALGDAQARGGDGDAARDTFQRAAAIARTAGLPEILAEAALAYGGRFVWVRAASDPLLMPLVDDALEALGEVESPLRVRLLARRAVALRGELPRELRAAVGDQAVAMARRIGDLPTLAWALDARCGAVEGAPNLAGTLADAEEIVALAEQLGDKERNLGGREHAFFAAWVLGDVRRREREHEVMVQLAAELRQPAQRWLLTIIDAARALSDGRFETAERLIEHSLRLGSRAQTWSAGVTHLIQTFVLCSEQGRLGEVEAMVRTAVRENPAYPIFRSLEAHMYARLGRRAEAAEALEALAADNFATVSDDEERLWALALLAEPCAFLGDDRLAAAIHELLRPWGHLVAVGTPEASWGSVARTLGALATQLRRWDEAERHFEDALEIDARMGGGPWLAHARHEYGAMLLARDAASDRDRALDLLAEAAATYSALGMDSWAEAASQLRADARAS